MYNNQEEIHMKRRIAALFMASLMGLSLTACGPSPTEEAVGAQEENETPAVQEDNEASEKTETPETSEAEGKEEYEDVTITFWNAWVGSDGETLTELVNQFNDENPYGITVDMTITSSVTEMLQSGLPTGDAADLFLGDTGCIHKYDGYLQSIDSVFAETKLNKEDFLASYLERCYGEDGKIYGLPFQIAQMCLFYNKDLFEQNGLDPDAPPVTWDEYQEYAEKMTDASSNTFGSGLYYCYQAQTGAFLQRFGGLVVDDTADGKIQVNLTDNQGLKDGLHYFYNIYKSGNNPYEKDIDSMMLAGQIGMMINGGWLKAGLDNAGINYGIAKVPVCKGDNIDSYALSDMSNFYVTTCADEEETWAVGKFLEWWFTGNEGTAVDDTANSRWSLEMGYIASYIPTINCASYQADELLTNLSVAADAKDVQTVLYCPAGSKCYTDASNAMIQLAEEWVYSDGSEATLDEMLGIYQELIENSVIENYGEEMLAQ